jgi:hypothetical protein
MGLVFKAQAHVSGRFEDRIRLEWHTASILFLLGIAVSCGHVGVSCSARFCDGFGPGAWATGLRIRGIHEDSNAYGESVRSHIRAWHRL